MKRLLAIAAGLAPAIALAADDRMLQVLDLTSGAPKALLGETTKLAWGFFVLAVVIGLVLEAFGSSPTQPRDFGGLAWRGILVVVLLSAYPKLFGTILATTQSVADRIAPKSTWETFAKNQEAYFNQLDAAKQQAAAAAEKQGGSTIIPDAKQISGYVGGAIFDGLLVLLLAAGQAFQWVFAQLTQILEALFYILGPLAIVWMIPRGSGTSGRWFRTFVTIATWPIFSALLLALSTEILFRGQTTMNTASVTASFGALASTLLLVCLTASVPKLASAIVGGAVGNILSPAAAGMAGAAAGFAEALPLRGSLAGGARSVMSGGASVAMSALRGAAGAMSAAVSPPAPNVGTPQVFASQGMTPQVLAAGRGTPAAPGGGAPRVPPNAAVPPTAASAAGSSMSAMGGIPPQAAVGPSSPSPAGSAPPPSGPGIPPARS